ncbi:unnamed protein product [Adineta ricciae]|uniref:Uncharacterized protein n=1 Tax=Adineta ricciae TaxID=249248 RepID=A0A815AZU5_ADIRI|nr:unnamed protein product [Adineta ricciae]
MKQRTFVWLRNVMDSSQDITELESLRILINNFMVFENEDECTYYIENPLEDDDIILIINIRLVEKILSKVHELPQISAIYIYGSCQKEYKEWTKKYTKIREIFIQVNELIKKLLCDSKEQEKSTHDHISFDIFNGHSTNELNGAFIYSQLLINCLIRLPLSDNETDEFISFYKSYEKQDKICVTTLEEFLRKYKTKSALWWYTTDNGVFRILNEALRNKDIDLLYYLRFFLHDIEKELQDIKAESLSSPVYRGQRISSDEIKKLQTAVGKLISVNTFFSTSRDSSVCFSFHGFKSQENNLENVLFQIDTGSHLNDVKPFADISIISSKKDEKELLFMAGSVFKIKNVCLYSKEFWHVTMELCSIKDEEFKSLMDYMNDEYEPDEVNLFFFGNILFRMDKLQDAKKYYDRFLIEVSDDHNDISGCYHSLGMIEEERGDYEESLKYLTKSLQIDEQLLSNMNRFEDHSNIGLSYNSIATVYSKKGDSEQAIDDDCLDVAGCYYNIGGVYQTIKKYIDAQDYYKKALEIRQKHLPENHSDIGQSQCSLGNIHLLLDEFDLALEKYYLALKIFNQSCPDQHIDIAVVLKNIGLLYEKKNDYQLSVTYLEKAKNIYINLALHEHPAKQKIDDSIVRVTSKLKE